MRPPRWLLKLLGPPKGRHALRAASPRQDTSEGSAHHRPGFAPTGESRLEADEAPKLNDDEPPVRLIFDDGTVGAFVSGSEEERRARYLARHLLSLR